MKLPLGIRPGAGMVAGGRRLAVGLVQFTVVDGLARELRRRGFERAHGHAQPVIRARAAAGQQCRDERESEESDGPAWVIGTR